MDPVAITNTALTLIEYGTKALKAAQIGKLEEAQKHLDDARDVWQMGSDAIDTAIEARQDVD